jgi:hypothetical protein
MKFEVLVEKTRSTKKMSYRDALKHVKETTTITTTSNTARSTSLSSPLNPSATTSVPQVNRMMNLKTQTSSEKISVSTQTDENIPQTHSQENSVSKLIELLSKLISLCQNSDNPNISDQITQIVDETFTVPAQTMQNQQCGTKPKTVNVSANLPHNNLLPNSKNQTSAAIEVHMQAPVIDPEIPDQPLNKTLLPNQNSPSVRSRPRKISRLHSPGSQIIPAPLTPEVIEVPFNPSPIIGRNPDKDKLNTIKGNDAALNTASKSSCGKTKDAGNTYKKLPSQNFSTKCLPKKK